MNLGNTGPNLATWKMLSECPVGACFCGGVFSVPVLTRALTGEFEERSTGLGGGRGADANQS